MTGVIPQVSPEELEKLLEILPNPSRIYFEVEDYAARIKLTYSETEPLLVRRIRELLPTVPLATEHIPEP